MITARAAGHMHSIFVALQLLQAACVYLSTVSLTQSYVLAGGMAHW